MAMKSRRLAGEIGRWALGVFFAMMRWREL
jgi:hypothetical protein